MSYTQKLAKDIPSKANIILNIVLLGLFLVGSRAWHLSVIKYDAYLEQSTKPQIKSIVEPAIRGTIRDRYNIPLAINTVQYDASLVYSSITQIPAVVWQKDANGKRVKFLKRRHYITQLSQLLGEKLGLDPFRLEDLIHSKASLYGHIPFTIKENITEFQYYQLKMMEKDWPGIHVLCVPKREYPKGKVACNILGYMGSISREQYDSIIHEIKELQAYIKGSDEGEVLPLPGKATCYDDACRLLEELEEKAYTINDDVGKGGIEERYEKSLRGCYGKKTFFADAKGHFLRQTENSREALPGSRVLLTISAELQEFAEKLLIQSEDIRTTKQLKEGQQWIKGGAIVAMDPKNGEILCLASYPRFDPNDFISSGNPEERARKQARISHWFETDKYIAELWDGKRVLEKETLAACDQEVVLKTLPITWETYLQFVLPNKGAVKTALDKVRTVKNAFLIQRDMEQLMQLSGFWNAYAVINHLYSEPPHLPYEKRMRAAEREELENRMEIYEEEVAAIKRRLDPFLRDIPKNNDKVMLIDLLRLAVFDEKMTPQLMQAIGNLSIKDYRNSHQAFIVVEDFVKETAKELFHKTSFKEWRNTNQTAYLKDKRAEEKKQHRYPKPYLDYLDAKERELFADFWEAHRKELTLAFILRGDQEASPWREAHRVIKETLEPLNEETKNAFIDTVRRYEELNRELLGKYRHLKKIDGKNYEKHLAAAFYPPYGYSFARSYAYQQAATQGSIFKIVTAYEALTQRLKKLKKPPESIQQLNPMTINEQFFRVGKDNYIGYQADGRPLPQFYKGGMLIKTMNPYLGEMDLLKAIEVSSNPYFGLLAAEHLEHPLDLAKSAKLFGYGQKTGIELPAEIAGQVPDDLDFNRTGLYAMAIGQHSLVVTPLQSATMLSSVANGGHVLKPKIVHMLAGEKPHEGMRTHAIQVVPTEIRKEISIAPIIRHTLIEGMRRVTQRMLKTGIWALTELYKKHPDAVSDFVEIGTDMAGKTSTSESMEYVDLETGALKFHHAWFGGMIFDTKQPEPMLFRDQFGKPELIVVVYLKYGNVGRDTAPVAAQIAKKWRQIKEKHKQDFL